MKRYFICLILTLISLAACHLPTVRQAAAPTEQITSQQVLQDLQRIRSSQAYTLQPGDLIDIQVFQEENMHRTLRLNSNGSVTFPLIGTIELSGLSVEQAEARLGDKLTNYLKNPQVSILVKEYGNKTVYVLGQVHKPAAIQIPPEKQLTVLEAITSVGGFTDIANTSKVRVLRVQDGQQIVLDVDVSQITKQGNKTLDIALIPGDVVFVPQSIF